MRLPRLRFTIRRLMVAVALVALYLALTVPTIRFVDLAVRRFSKVKTVTLEQRLMIDLTLVVVLTLFFSGAVYQMLMILRRAKHVRSLLRSGTGKEEGPAAVLQSATPRL